MEGAIITTFIIMLLVSAAIGGLILWGLARGLAKIETAKYLNSALICLISSAVVYLVLLVFDKQLAELGLTMLSLFALVLSAIVYITVGKMIWKCSWGKSFLANIVWILINTALIYWSTSQSMQ
ncbi:MAG: hypothetical protein AB7V36_04520 [Bacteroidales bacterium]|jgi:hypothetical protein|nr:hypothetical protein [Bacteroidales bacterium]HPE99882.1 hypothetical protein [Bacteroidales bacterium]